MRIDVNSPAASLLSANWSQSQAAKAVSGGAEKAAEDRTTFSPAGDMVKALTAQALNMPEVRQDRVEALRQAVASGAYPLEATGIAAAIVNSGEEQRDFTVTILDSSKPAADGALAPESGQADALASASPASEESAACCQQCLDALRLEIANAIEAIGANALDRLRDSIAQQEALCVRLRIMASASHSGPAKPALLYRECQESYRMLRAISLEYAAILRHSGRTIALLASLHRGHRGEFLSVAGSELDRPMWFCEA